MNITYLIGAGASFEALPIVSQIEDKLLGFSELFKPSSIHERNSSSFFDSKNSNLSNSYLSQFKFKSDIFLEKYNLIKTIHREINWLYGKSRNQSSIDTLAKKLFLQKDYKNLKRLKVIMSCFFYYCQITKFDKRYDSFFASILDELDTIPNNIRVVSWNYDSQFEIAFKEFSKGTIDSAKKTLNLQVNGLTDLNGFDAEKFSIFKLNGMTVEKNGKLINDYSFSELKMMEEIITIYEKEVYANFESSMYFAWENFNLESDFYKGLSESIANTEVLIVIGYSFPFFNRKIDAFLLNSMHKLKKVYVQDPEYSNEIIEKIKGLKPWQLIKISGGGFEKKVVTKDMIEFIPKTFTDQFFIPIEF